MARAATHIQPQEKPLPPYVTDGEGCHSCPHWERHSAVTGYCWPPSTDNEFALRPGTMTCFAHICPLHPKYEARHP